MNCNKSSRGPLFFPILFIRKGRGNMKKGRTESKPLHEGVETSVHTLLNIPSLKVVGAFSFSGGYFPEPEMLRVW
jgi:hypothetical protein